jgi:hypothetical protein
MFIGGSGSGNEFSKNDQGFYRGIVVKNNDPLRLNRVKIYISELSNQPFEEWFDSYESIEVKTPGKNNKEDKWSDVDIFEEISKNLPWAEPCYPIIGESGNSRYYKDGKIVTISDCNYLEGFEVINDQPPSLEKGSFSPSFLYENSDTYIGDAFSNPAVNFSGQCNPYSFLYKPSSHTNKAKGVFGIPEVGSKVWVFHWQGDYNFPVYFGSMKDSRELSLMNDTDNSLKISPTYPVDFEN